MQKKLPVVVGLACLSLLACEKRDGITVREEPHMAAAPVPVDAAAPSMPKTRVGPGQTLWAGALPVGDQQWVIFKAIAATEDIAKHAEELAGILKANDGTLPVGWTQEEASPQAAQFGRLYTLHSPAPEITVAVNKTGGSVASNINRWRGQAGLPELPEAESAGLAKKLDGGAWMVTVEGKAEMAGVDDREKTGSGTASASLTFTLPHGWQQVAPSSDMRLAQFKAGEGDQACEVAITRFPGAIGKELGSTLDNLNRWRAQVGLAAWKELPATAQAVPMNINGYPGAVVQVAAAEGEPAAAKAALVAFVADEKNTFFIKLSGPTAAAEAQLLPMLDFLKTLKLPVTGAAAPLPADLKMLPKIGK